MKSSTAGKSHVSSTWDTGIHGRRAQRGQGKDRGINVGYCERGPPSQGAGFSQSYVSPLRCFPSHSVTVEKCICLLEGESKPQGHVAPRPEIALNGRHRLFGRVARHSLGTRCPLPKDAKQSEFEGGSWLELGPQGQGGEA